MPRFTGEITATYRDTFDFDADNEAEARDKASEQLADAILGALAPDSEDVEFDDDEEDED